MSKDVMVTDSHFFKFVLFQKLSCALKATPRWCKMSDASMEGMEFYLTTPPPNDKSYEEKRKYKKRKSYQYLGEDCLEVKERY